MGWQQFNRMSNIRNWMFGSEVSIPHKALFPLNKGDFFIRSTETGIFLHCTFYISAS